MTEAAEQTQSVARPAEVTEKDLDGWANDLDGPVALHLKQELVPVEVGGRIIFPPTYADIGYNIDTLADGTRVAAVDSVGSQANRLEPLFKAGADAKPESWLVPQIEVLLPPKPCGTCEACTSGKKGAKCTNPCREKRSLLDLAHRSADAVVQSTPTLASKMGAAFETLRKTGDAGPLCTLAPTSLVFGVWDSRGGTGEKRPRLVRAMIRAWDVEPLHAAAQFNSVWKAIPEEQQGELEKEAKQKKVKLSEKGLADAPAVFRKVSTTAAKYMREFQDGSPNAERRVLGGILVNGKIERDVTVNLVALRGLRGKNDDESKHLREYLLGLSLIAAASEIDLFLREGCHLRYGSEDVWHSIPRRGDPTPLAFGSDEARQMVWDYTDARAKHFRPRWEKELGGKFEHEFDLKEAKKLLAKKDEETPEGE